MHATNQCAPVPAADRPVPPPFTTDPSPDVAAEVTVMIASGEIRADEADIARFLIESQQRLDALAAKLAAAR